MIVTNYIDKLDEIRQLNNTFTSSKSRLVEKTIEEMAELTKELLKTDSITSDGVIEELADVIVMTRQLKKQIEIDTENKKIVDDVIEYKINRTYERLGGEKC